MQSRPRIHKKRLINLWNMKAYKMYTLLILIIITQSTLCQPVQSSPEDIESIIDEIQIVIDKAVEKYVVLKVKSLSTIPHKVAARIVNAIKLLMQDAAFVNNKQPEVLMFRNNLTIFLDNYDPSVNKKSLEKTMNLLFDTIRPYIAATLEYKFIGNLLNKYHLKEVSTNLDIYEEVNNIWAAVKSIALKLSIRKIGNVVYLPIQYASNKDSLQLLKDC